MAAVAALTLLGTFGGASVASAAPQVDPPGCGDAICLWSGYNYAGAEMVYIPGEVYRNLPDDLLHSVGSFYSGGYGCFIRWTGGKQTRPVQPGDYQAYYGRSFGSLMEAVGDNC